MADGAAMVGRVYSSYPRLDTSSHPGSLLTERVTEIAFVDGAMKRGFRVGSVRVPPPCHPQVFKKQFLRTLVRVLGRL